MSFNEDNKIVCSAYLTQRNNIAWIIIYSFQSLRLNITIYTESLNSFSVLLVHFYSFVVLDTSEDQTLLKKISREERKTGTEKRLGDDDWWPQVWCRLKNLRQSKIWWYLEARHTFKICNCLYHQWKLYLAKMCLLSQQAHSCKIHTLLNKVK